MTIRSKVPTKTFRDNYDQIEWNLPKEGSTVPKKGKAEYMTPLMMADIAPYQATDGTIISGRRRQREYMKANGLAHVDDFTEHFKAKAKERELRSQGRHPEQIRDRIRTLSDAYEHARDKTRYSRY